MPATLVWFRRDLRLADHAALTHAVERGEPVVPVFVWEPDGMDWPHGGAQRVWLRATLDRLDAALRKKGSRLTIRIGETAEALRTVAKTVGADRIVWTAPHTPTERTHAESVRETLDQAGLDVRTFAGELLHTPDAIETTTGGSYSVFTPFWKKLQSELEVGEPLPVPRMGERLAPGTWPDSEPLGALDLTAEQQDGTAWDASIFDYWTAGEDAAHRRLDAFLDAALADYPDDRNRPDRDGTSRLSPYLTLGVLSPRQVWARTQEAASNSRTREAAEVYLSEIAWREFAYHVLHHNPHTATEPLREKYAKFPWRDDQQRLEAWQQGRTGYPIVDAGMRQLWALGWMHNRVRMIVASFLTKDLGIPWQRGTEWFWDTLIDADLANNSLNWQWAAGSGADAQPFFRIFNPVSQGKRFDPDGEYVRQWVPEIADLPSTQIHAPWTASKDTLREAGVTLGETYPEPIVDHAKARDEALEAYETIR